MVKVPKSRTVGCENCYGKGYLVEKQGKLSVGKICGCVSKCAECNGVGSILFKNDNGYTYVNICNVCGAVRKKVKLYNLAGIPAKYSHVLQVDAAFQHKNNASLHEALKYAKNEFVTNYPYKRGFLLMGGPGCGKTHLAVGTISELILERGVRCIFKDFFNLLSELKEAYSQGISENEVISPLIETEVLVIDELGKGESNKWELNILDQLISKRYNASKTTLITTNYVSREYAAKIKEEQQILEDKVGERISSRLYEMCEFIYIEASDHRGESYKKAKKKG